MEVLTMRGKQKIEHASRVRCIYDTMLVRGWFTITDKTSNKDAARSHASLHLFRIFHKCERTEDMWCNIIG